MKQLFLIILYVLIAHIGFSQVTHGGYKNNVILGTGGPLINSFYGNTVINYNTNFTDTSVILFPRHFHSATSSISSSSGQLLFYFNGFTLGDRWGNIPAQADSFGKMPVNTTAFQSYSLGSIAHNGSVIIFKPGDSTRYYLIYNSEYKGPVGWASQFDLYASGLLRMAEIGVNDTGGVTVISRDQIILNDTTENVASIAACKHANGRDWWVIVLKYGRPEYFSFLFTPDSIYTTKHTFPLPYAPNKTNQMTFSPKGDMLAIHGNLTKTRVFNFDRCIGAVTGVAMYDTIWPPPYPLTWDRTGCAFSPSGRYLYTNAAYDLFRYDLQAANPILSRDTIIHMDGYYFDPYNGQAATFYDLYLANDGKVYLHANASVKSLTVIHDPDNPVAANTNPSLFGFPLPRFNAYGSNNHPNYYLGQLSGSTCDTLGLTVANQNKENKLVINVYPIPANEQLNITYEPPTKANGIAIIYDTDGKLLKTQTLPIWSAAQSINVKDIPNGIYALKVTIDNRTTMIKVLVAR